MNASQIIAQNVKRLREGKGWSQSQLAEKAEMSKVIISQIEKGDANPTINTIWKLAKAFSLPYTSLLDPPEAKAVYVKKTETSEMTDGEYRIFNYYPSSRERDFEIYQFEVEPNSEHTSMGHSSKSFEYIMMTEGELKVKICGDEYDLTADDALYFEADSEHTYINPTNETARAWMIIQYLE